MPLGPTLPPSIPAHGLSNTVNVEHEVTTSYEEENVLESVAQATTARPRERSILFPYDNFTRNPSMLPRGVGEIGRQMSNAPDVQITVYLAEGIQD
jgi:hypothetical protein